MLADWLYSHHIARREAATDLFVILVLLAGLLVASCWLLVARLRRR
jgi:hypothetical protein